MQNDTISDNSLVFSFKVKHTYKPAIPLLGILHKISKNTCLHKDLYTNVHGSFTHINQNLEKTPLSIKKVYK